MSTGQRIKYKNYKDSHKITVKQYTSKSNGAKYRIIINLEAMEFYIRNERNKEFVYKSTTYTNLNALKKNARTRLEKLGVVLKTESRFRMFGLCEKGMTQKKWEEEQKRKKDDL